MSTEWKPLTPELRDDINNSIKKNYAELSTCEINAFTTAQKVGLQTLSRLINALPDGYPIPFERINGGC